MLHAHMDSIKLQTVCLLLPSDFYYLSPMTVEMRICDDSQSAQFIDYAKAMNIIGVPPTAYLPRNAGFAHFPQSYPHRYVNAASKLFKSDLHKIKSGNHSPF